MAAALERALPNMPSFYADGLTKEQHKCPTTLEELRARPGDEHRATRSPTSVAAAAIR